MTALPKYDPDSQNPFQVDLRMADLSGLDLKGAAEGLAFATFGTTTVWPAKDKMPEGFDPKAIMEMGKNPGLGVRGLHARGITGKGVRIAIIDQPLPVDHEEFGGPHTPVRGDQHLQPDARADARAGGRVHRGGEDGRRGAGGGDLLHRGIRL